MFENLKVLLDFLSERNYVGALFHRKIDNLKDWKFLDVSKNKNICSQFLP